MKRMTRFGAVGALALAFALAGAWTVRAEEDEKADEAKGPALSNRKCPVSGKDAKDDKFIDYADDTGKVYGRVHFCCGNCQKGAEGKDAAGKKELYAKAYLAPRREGGKAMEYGKTRIDVANKKCPVSGHDASGKNAVNYNGMAIQLCCDDCKKELLANPDKALGAVKDDVKAAIQAKREARKKGDK